MVSFAASVLSPLASSSVITNPLTPQTTKPQNSPFQATSIPNLFLAGDWVKGVPTGANGLSQERAFVTGLTAANLVIDRLGVGAKAVVKDVEPDEPHIAAGRAAVRTVRDVLGNVCGGFAAPLAALPLAPPPFPFPRA